MSIALLILSLWCFLLSPLYLNHIPSVFSLGREKIKSSLHLPALLFILQKHNGISHVDVVMLKELQFLRWISCNPVFLTKSQGWKILQEATKCMPHLKALSNDSWPFCLSSTSSVCVCVCVCLYFWGGWVTLIHGWPVLTDGKVLLIYNFNLTSLKLPFGKLVGK